MERWTLIRKDRREQTVKIYPSAGKLTGRYPTDYKIKEKNTKDEQQMAGK